MTGSVKAPTLLINGNRLASHTVVLAHGAGAPMDSPFMNTFAEGLVERGIRSVRFEFPYMEARRRGVRPGPNPTRVLEDTWRAVINKLGSRGLVIGGKSMGGRIASMVADEAGVSGVICLGYPFHPPGRPNKLRISHLARLRTPALVLQGTRDPFGTPDEVRLYELSPNISVRWLEDGDHSFKPRKVSGRSQEQVCNEAIIFITQFLTTL